jgi:hypothetical protein
VLTSQIVTSAERYALRAGLARRDALGERMGVGRGLEEVLGVALGRWTFDVWVAQGAVATAFGGLETDGAGGWGRVGAVWLGSPGG